MIHIVTGGGFWGGWGGGGIFSFVVDCKQTGCSSVQMCVVTNYNQSLCSSVDDHIVTGGVLGGGWGGIFSFVVDCKQTGCSSVQMCVVTNYNQSWCFFGG